MDYEKFSRSLSQMLLMKQVLIAPDHTEMLYSLLKDDFTDGDFEIICVRITKNDTLYNKYPDPALFAKHKKELDYERGKSIYERRMNAIYESKRPSSGRIGFNEALSSE